jgi:hypothetical protein
MRSLPEQSQVGGSGLAQCTGRGPCRAPDLTARRIMSSFHKPRRRAASAPKSPLSSASCSGRFPSDSHRFPVRRGTDAGQMVVTDHHYQSGLDSSWRPIPCASAISARGSGQATRTMAQVSSQRSASGSFSGAGLAASLRRSLNEEDYRPYAAAEMCASLVVACGR